MRMFVRLFGSIVIMLFAGVMPSWARPVSYPGGWTLMQMNDVMSHSLHLHYSPTARYSLGYKGEYFREDDWQFHGAQLNYLLTRFNQPKAQANIYLKSAMGVAYSDKGVFENKTHAAGFAGIAADWENRRFFSSYENRGIYAGDISKQFSQKARIGIAPYVGDYGDVHTWLMLQVDHVPSAEDELTITPLVRFFKGADLMEAGVNNNGKILFNYVHRF